MKKLEIKIDSNIPMPMKKRRGFNSYPFHEMKVGDSFFVPLKEGKKQHSLICQISTSARLYSMASGKGWRFTTRSVEGGCRVWRVN